MVVLCVPDAPDALVVCAVLCVAAVLVVVVVCAVLCVAVVSGVGEGVVVRVGRVVTPGRCVAIVPVVRGALSSSTVLDFQAVVRKLRASPETLTPQGFMRWHDICRGDWGAWKLGRIFGRLRLTEATPEGGVWRFDARQSEGRLSHEWGRGVIPNRVDFLPPAGGRVAFSF